MRIYVLDILRVNGASLDVKFNESPTRYGFALDSYTFPSPVGFRGKVINMAGILKISGILEIDYEVKCSRCLKSINGHDNIEICENIIDAKKASDIEAYTYSDNYFEIDRILWDNIILGMPMKRVCSVECKGLCPVCGSDLNIASCNCDKDSVNVKLEDLRRCF